MNSYPFLFTLSLIFAQDKILKSLKVIEYYEQQKINPFVRLDPFLIHEIITIKAAIHSITFLTLLKIILYYLLVMVVNQFLPFITEKNDSICSFKIE